MVYAVAVEARLVLLYSVAINLACVSGHSGHRRNLSPTPLPSADQRGQTQSQWGPGSHWLCDARLGRENVNDHKCQSNDTPWDAC